MRHLLTITTTAAACLLAVVGCALAAAAASAQFPGVGADLPPVVPPAPVGARILQAGSTVGDAEVTRLLREIELAGGSPVIVRVPGSARAELSDAALGDLAKARDGGELVVVQQGDADINGAAAILEAYADSIYLQPGAKLPSGKPGESKSLDAVTTELGLSETSPTVQSDLSVPSETLGDALRAPAPDDGGIGVRLILLGALVLAGVVVAVLYLRPRRSGAAVPASGPAPETRPSAETHHPRRTPRVTQHAPLIAAPAPTGGGHPAEVVSVLDPEGYVELDRCLRRVRWGSTSDTPAVAGDWVEVEQRDGRLWAFPARNGARA